MNDRTGQGVTSSAEWAAFWAGEHSIYVSPRHVDAHYGRIATDVVALLAGRSRPILLDWGCGDALGAPHIARVAGEVWLYDGVPAVGRRLASRYREARGIRVLDDAAWRALPHASVDVILLNSVAQYLSRDDLATILGDFRRVVRGDGEVLLADIIPPDAGIVPDVVALLGSGLAHGFFWAAVRGLARTWFSRYRRIRAEAGFSTYTPADVAALAAHQGFSVERLPANIGFNRQRMTFRLRPVA